MQDIFLEFGLTVASALVAPVALIAAGGLVMGVTKLAKLTGVNITARQQATLHSAIETGVKMALARGLRGGTAVNAAIAYAKRDGARDTIAKLGVSEQGLLDLAFSKMQQTVDKK